MAKSFRSHLRQKSKKKAKALSPPFICISALAEISSEEPSDGDRQQQMKTYRKKAAQPLPIFVCLSC